MWKTLRQISRIGSSGAAPGSGRLACGAPRRCSRVSFRCSDARFASGRSMPDPAMAASSKYTRSIIRSTISKGWVFGSWRVRATRTCCWLPARSRRTWRCGAARLRCDPGSQTGGRGRRLRLHGRHIRRKLCELRPGINVIPVDVAVPGCPPSPRQILAGILDGDLRSAPR